MLNGSEDTQNIRCDRPGRYWFFVDKIITVVGILKI